jgi:hypothetical protein
MRKTLVACVAVALLVGGGSAFAAAQITSKDIKNGTIKAVDISRGAKKALKGRAGTQGARGPQGVAGPQGPAGPSLVGQMTTVSSADVPFGAEVVQQAIAFCPAGQRVVSGGGFSVSDEQLAANGPTPGRTGWFVIGIDLVEDDPSSPSYILATANCAPTGRAVAASVRSRAHERRAVARTGDKIEAQVKDLHGASK